MELDQAAVGRRIAQARKEAGITTQEELGDLLGVSRRSIQFYEEGKTVPYRHFRTLEALTGKGIGWFLYGQEGERTSSSEWRELRDLLSARHEAVLSKLDVQDERLRALIAQVADLGRRLERLEGLTLT